MKNPVAVVLVTVALSTMANEPKKRPSWSQGLPERQAVPSLYKPQLEPPEFNPEQIVVEPPTVVLPETQAMPTSTQVPVADEAHAVGGKDTASEQLNEAVVVAHALPPKRQQDVRPDNEMSTDWVSGSNERQLNIQSETSQSVLISEAQYSWKLLRQNPVEVSSMLLSDTNNIQVRISVNNQGQVIGVEAVQAETPTALVQQASRAIKRWRFAEPAEEGVEASVLSKVFEVELQRR